MTKRIISAFLGLGLGIALMATAFAVPASAASKVPATIRVVTASGKILVDKSFDTGTTTVKSKASGNTCFGGTSTASSKKLAGPTSLGLLYQAQSSVKSLRPFLISNEFDFGLAVCEIGGVTPPSTGFWLFKHNHAVASTGAEITKVKKNDVDLWYEVKDFNEPTPAELFLKAPVKVKKGSTSKVRVFAYDDKGKRKPVEGAKLSVGGALTDSKGYTKVTFKKKTSLIARVAGAIPSNRAVVQIKK